MKEFFFENQEEFQKLMQKETTVFSRSEIAETGTQAIDKALKEGKKTVVLYRITVDNITMDVSLPYQEWGTFLNEAIEVFHSNEKYDQAFKTWELLDFYKNS